MTTRLNHLLLVVIGAASLGSVVYIADSEARRSVDVAQGDFEAMESGLNWEGWRANKKLRCVDSVVARGYPKLRVCRIQIQFIDPFTREETPGEQVFVCSTEHCAWVKPP